MTPVLPLGVAFAAALALTLLDGRRRWVGVLAIALHGATLAALVLVATHAADGAAETVTGGWPAGLGIRLRADGLGLVFAVLAAVVLLLALADEVALGIRSRWFPALVAFLLVGLTGVFLTADAFNFYVFFEITMAASFALGSYGATARRLRAAWVFAAVNLVGSAFFLVGVGALYHLTGTLDFPQIAARAAAVEPGSLALVGAIFLAAFGLKLGLFPFHAWAPAVYRGTDPAVAAVLAGAVANVGSYGLLRFGVEVLPATVATGAPVLLVLGGLSALYGGVLARNRRQLGETLAYSSIAQAGFVLAAIAVGGEAGVAAAITVAIASSLAKAALFLLTTRRGALGAVAFAAAACSVAGLPPTAGFLAKLQLFRAAILAGNAPLLAVVAGASALSFLYMFQAFQRHVWAAAGADGEERRPRAVPVILALGIVALGAWPEPLLRAGAAVARELARGAP